MNEKLTDNFNLERDADICFLGGIYPKEHENEVKKNSKHGVDNAANNMQWKYIKGLDACLSNPVYILNSMYIGSYPKHYKKVAIKGYEFSHTNSTVDHNVGFINLYGIKNFIRFIKLKPYLKKWARQKEKAETKIIFAYAMTYTFLKCLAYIKKYNSNITTCLIVPDLPEYMNTTNKRSLLYDFLKKIEINKIQKNMKFVDKYVFLTDQMAQKLGIKQSDYIVVEGMIESNSNEQIDVVDTEYIYTFNENDIYLCYTGTLNEKYGIKKLIQVMNYIKEKNIKLLICGRGDSEDYIQNAANVNKNIIYLGEVPAQSIKYILSKSDLLINPRPNNEEYTKYSFPSKTMEYILSGVPTIAFNLDGIPDEYDSYLNYFSSSDEKNMAKDIVNIIENQEAYLNKAQLGKVFVTEKKNNVFSSNKILNFLIENDKASD